MKLKRVFERKENKYLFTKEQFKNFKKDLEQHMLNDQYGLHTISSLYYDTDNFYFINHSINKPDYKEKFRVRQYGQFDPNKPVFLEIKKKVRGIVYKRRIELNINDYQLFVKNKSIALNQTSHPQIAKEIQWLFSRYQDLQPKVMIAYDRLSYYTPDNPEFRVTFDQNIRYRDCDLSLKSGDYGNLVTDKFDVLMEVKAMGAYPLWFTHLLAKHQIKKGKFSKYAYVYQNHIPKEELLNAI